MKYYIVMCELIEDCAYPDIYKFKPIYVSTEKDKAVKIMEKLIQLFQESSDTSEPIWHVKLYNELEEIYENCEEIFEFMTNSIFSYNTNFTLHELEV